MAPQSGLEPGIYGLIFPRKVTLGMKAISFRAGIVSIFPVLGFRPGRDDLARTLNLQKTEIFAS